MLQEDAVRSAQIYLDYLIAHKDEGLGMVRARVRGIQGSLLSEEMVLFVDRVLRSAENLVLRVGGTVYENTPEQMYFRIVSVNRRKVVMAPSPEVAEHISSAFDRREPVILESDLTFLVKRVQSWYEKYGGKVCLPAAVPGKVIRLDPENPIALSDNQYDCAALAMSSPLTYIWGAPGTGKTKHVLASCVLSYLRAGKKVILAAPTNAALEQSLRGLLQALVRVGVRVAGTVIRLGIPGEDFHMAWKEVCEDGARDWMHMDIQDKIDGLKYRNSRIEEALAVRAGKARPGAADDYPEKDDLALAREKKKNTAEVNALLVRSRKLSEQGIMSQIAEFSVVACTVDTCIFKLAPGGAFQADHVFLDEAGYCNVIKGMTLLGFGKPLTLLGDHKQLPPVFEGERELLRDPEKQLTRLWKISSLYLEQVVSCENLGSFCRADPVRPVFDRVQEGDLCETYRFGPELAGVLARRIYGPRFCSRSENETKILFVNAPKSDADKGKDEEGKSLRMSHREARCIRSLVECNLNRTGMTMGIITPYRAQRRLLSDSVDSLMKKYHIEDDMEDDIVTVHRSQGREWDIVLFSVTDCFDEKHFTDTVRLPEAMMLINTAVSRARKILVLVGDAEDWKGKPGYLISELFAVGTEISPKERLADSLYQQEDTDGLFS